MEHAVKTVIGQGEAALGIELGSTRIKAVLIDKDYQPIASGSHEWENQLENGYWTYDLKQVWAGLQASLAQLREQLKNQHGLTLDVVGSIGISAMMHGYLPFDSSGELLTPFRTWRNTTTAQAADQLTKVFHYNIPQRWSIAHLYQALLNQEAHVKDIAFITTLAGYVHWRLTGEKVLGVGDASGMFPIDSSTGDYDAAMLKQFAALPENEDLPLPLKQLLPRPLSAGAIAGRLTAEGALLLDPSGELSAGISLCPPEGDAGTGMVATNSVAARTGNVSAGTSIFSMVVLEKPLARVHMELDMVTTPAGKPVAMVHCNNCTSDLDAWVKLFGQACALLGTAVDKTALYTALYRSALQGDADCGGMIAFNYYSGEPITGMEEGRPLFARMPDSRFTLANFIRCHLLSAMATLKIGMDILAEEGVCLDRLLGHGGLFKIEGVAQRLMAGALGVPVAVMPSAGEGGAWGIALLAAYSQQKSQSQTLEDFLEQRVFADANSVCIQPDPQDADGFNLYMQRYKNALEVQRAAVQSLNEAGLKSV